MTKAELLKLLEQYDDNDVIAIWLWNRLGNGKSEYFETIPTIPSFNAKSVLPGGRKVFALYPNYHVPELDVR